MRLAGRKVSFFIDNDAADRLAQAWEFLVLPKASASEAGNTKGKFRLPSAQAVDLAQNSPDVFLLLLRWIDRLTAAGIEVPKLDEKIHRRTLGFLTALAWFAPDKGKACAAIWAELEGEIDAKKLIDRFNATRFKSACRISEHFTLQMIPLPTPDELATVCGRFINRDNRTKQTQEKATVHFPKGSFWTDNNWWYDKLSVTLANSIKQDWQERLTVRAGDDEEAPDYSMLVEQAAQRFLDTLWGAKTSVLLYAQRAWLQRWFPKFDPSLPEMMEDKNRPWDIDHILPQSYFNSRRNVPQSVKDWGNSIGNLRAWPLEANRADGDIPPKIKLTDTSSEEKRYGISTGQDERAASFVVDNLDWPHWEAAVPTKENDGEVCAPERK